MLFKSSFIGSKIGLFWILRVADLFFHERRKALFNAGLKGVLFFWFFRVDLDLSCCKTIALPTDKKENHEN